MSAYLPSIAIGPSFAGTLTTDRTRAHAQEVVRSKARRAVLVGTADPHVSSLLTDVLRDIALDVELLDYDTEAPDVVLAMVDRADGVRAISEARSRFPKAPVVAILTLGTHRLGTRAVAAGAQACYVLDMPIDRLRNLINALLKESAAPSAHGSEDKRARRNAR